MVIGSDTSLRRTGLVYSGSALVGMLVFSLGIACGSESNSEIASQLGCGNTTGDTPHNTGGKTSTPKPPTPSAGSGGNSGSTSGGNCAQGSFTDAIHITMQVKWAGTSTRTGGASEIHAWNRLSLTANGDQISGKMWPCGTIVPPTQLQGLAGNKKVLIELPDSIWDSTQMQSFDVQGTQAGTGEGSTLTLAWISTVGLTLDDPSMAWPKFGKDLLSVGVDVDGDEKPGYTALPRDGGDYTLPPVAVGVGPWASHVYLVSRHNMSIEGTRSSCEAAVGSVNVAAFDSHVLGCFAKPAIGEPAPCTDDQAKFLDENRMIYEVVSATFETMRVADNATCSDVRAALPGVAP